jgi:hypothetical protein
MCHIQSWASSELVKKDIGHFPFISFHFSFFLTINVALP